ncbi:MAG TPA: GDSL-type esterase/lipase family protein, partial [Elusimicrobiota bacterium]|nr:GDSL-type esterase/lipase family protein [Elusimicrobiota bacterium]
MKKSLSRAGLVAFGLFLFPVGPELLLRTMAHLYRKTHIAIPATEHPDHKILCLGDSFTFGVGARLGQDYPHQLQDILSSRGHRVNVINQGIPNQRSGNVARTAPRLLDRYEPDIVLLLIGFNDPGYLGPKDYEPGRYKRYDMNATVGLVDRLSVAAGRSRLFRAAQHLQRRWRDSHPRTSAGPVPVARKLPAPVHTLDKITQAYVHLYDRQEYADALRLFTEAWAVEKTEEALYGALETT